MESMDEHSSTELHLEHLLSIWPIISSVASHASAGDIISLSRASYRMRVVTHGFPPDNNSGELSDNESRRSLDLCLGKHQTSHWAGLKSLAQFTCCSPSHKDPKSSTGSKNTVRPCKFCSRPICKACIVRSFFSDPSHSKNTFRYRTRYLCVTCWDTGNLRKDFRYPADTTSREHIWRGQSYGQRGSRCSCSASEDNWLCHGCRVLQNISGPTNSTLFNAHQDALHLIQRNRQPEEQSNFQEEIICYGLGCVNVIDQHNKDRRRICLWCSKSLPRQYGGEDRLRWEEKQVEIRAAAAASRSADIREWARNRFRSLTMSRRELRGTEQCILLTGMDGPEHDQPIFVRHLDAINYRKYLPEFAAPSPENVYQSKHGRWTYSTEFLLQVNQRTRGGLLLSPPGVDADTLFETTRRGGMTLARSNKALHDISRLSYGYKEYGRGTLIRLSAQFYEAGLMTKEDFDNIHIYSWTNAGRLEKLRDKMCEQLELWEDSSECEWATREPVPFGVLIVESKARKRTPGGTWVRANEPVENNNKTMDTEASGETEEAETGDAHDDREETSDEELALQDQPLEPATSQPTGPVGGHYVFSPDGIDVVPFQSPA